MNAEGAHCLCPGIAALLPASRKGSLCSSSAELALLVAAGKGQLYAMLTVEAQDETIGRTPTPNAGSEVLWVVRTTAWAPGRRAKFKDLRSIGDLDTRAHDSRKDFELHIL